MTSERYMQQMLSRRDRIRSMDIQRNHRDGRFRIMASQMQLAVPVYKRLSQRTTESQAYYKSAHCQHQPPTRTAHCIHRQTSRNVAVLHRVSTAREARGIPASTCMLQPTPQRLTAEPRQPQLGRHSCKRSQ